MENKKRALGMGLEQLFNNENIDLNSIEEKIYESASSEEIIEINLDELRANPYQPRKVFDDKALDELALSIKEHGVFQPIIIKKSIKGYEIIAGERRARASKKAGLTKIPAIIRNFSDEQMMEIALLENLQRENLNAIEEAEAYNAMLVKLGLTQEQLANKVGKSRTYITNMLGLLRLPSKIKDMIGEKQISMSHARLLSKMDSDEEIEKMAEQIINGNLPVRTLEKMTSKEEVSKKNKIVRRKENSDYDYAEELLREKLDAKIKIRNNKIEITFNSYADLNRILDIIKMGE
ncbi:MAG: ParB/RepB/Spo0J family partition protein [Bacilli bacterium]|nr:ParB/RepB/Spo0J family partition protein [Bacilli bacterium]